MLIKMSLEFSFTFHETELVLINGHGLKVRTPIFGFVVLLDPLQCDLAMLRCISRAHISVSQ
jgi:hypothetical protein